MLVELVKLIKLAVIGLAMLVDLAAFLVSLLADVGCRCSEYLVI